MALPNPLTLRHKILSTNISFTSFQLQGERERQEDFVHSDSEDTFVLADGEEKESGKLCAESAIWTIQLAKKRFAYWKDKRLLGGRIARSVNLALYKSGLSSTLTVLLFGETQFYIYNIGNSQIYLFKNEILTLLTQLDDQVLGIEKKAPVPFFYADKLHKNDIFLLCSDGVGDFIKEKDVKKILSSDKPLLQQTKELITLAKKKGSTDNMTVCLVKYIVY